MLMQNGKNLQPLVLEHEIDGKWKASQQYTACLAILDFIRYRHLSGFCQGAIEFKHDLKTQSIPLIFIPR